jgi:hypothetical protein
LPDPLLPVLFGLVRLIKGIKLSHIKLYPSSNRILAGKKFTAMSPHPKNVKDYPFAERLER